MKVVVSLYDDRDYLVNEREFSAKEATMEIELSELVDDMMQSYARPD